MSTPRPRSSVATTFSLHIDDDGLRAVARRLGPEVPSYDEVEMEMAQLGVVSGVDRAAVERLCAGRAPPGVDVVVARGKPAVRKVGPRVDYRFVLPKDNLSYTGRAGDAQVDYREGFLTETVAAGDVLAVRIPPIEGSPGRTVTGAEIPMPESPGTSFEVGRNVKLSEDGRQAIATASGAPTLQRGRIAVVITLEVAGVNYATGNIHYDGPVLVKGDVATGFSVCATGDIVVLGVVEGGTLISAGNITVRAGARAGSRVEAAGNVAVRFLDSDAEANAVGDVTVVGSAIQCHLSAGRTLRVGQNLTGSLARAGLRMDVREAGCDRGTPALLEIKRDATPEQREELRRLVDELERRVEALERRARRVVAGDVQTRKAIVAEHVQVEVEIAFARARLAACDRALAGDPTEGEVLVRRRPWIGVDVVVHGNMVPGIVTSGGVRFVHSENGRPYEAPAWVTATGSVPPPHGSSPPPAGRQSSASIRTLRRSSGYIPTLAAYPRPSLAPGSRPSIPALSRSSPSLQVPRSSLLPGSRTSFPAVPRVSNSLSPRPTSIVFNPPLPRDEPADPPSEPPPAPSSSRPTR